MPENDQEPGWQQRQWARQDKAHYEGRIELLENENAVLKKQVQVGKRARHGDCGPVGEIVKIEKFHDGSIFATLRYFAQGVWAEIEYGLSDFIPLVETNEVQR